MVRFVHVKMSGGRAKTSTHARVADALDHAQRIGGCVHRVVYGSRGVVTSMRKVGCYSGGQSFSGYSKHNRKSRRTRRYSKRRS